MSAPNLNGYALESHFRRLRARWRFTPLEHYLFSELIAICNKESWPADFGVTNAFLAAELGCSEKGLIKARKTLESAGLITYTEGRNRRPTVYRFYAKGLPEVSISDSEHLPEALPEVSVSASKMPKPLPEHLPEALPEVSPYKEQTKTKKEESSAASAATPPLSFSAEKSESPKLTAHHKKSAARAEEIAALTLTHPGPKFAELWAAFLTSPKQAKKPITALKLILTKLDDYAEGFACQLLEDAIQGDWSGVVFDSTAEKYAKWLAVEAARAHRQPTRTNSATNDGPALNHEFIAEVAAREQKEIDDHLARYSQPSVVVDPDKEFGYNQTAAEGLAQAKLDPAYQQYLAELAAEQASEQPDPAPESP